MYGSLAGIRVDYPEAIAAFEELEAELGLKFLWLARRENLDAELANHGEPFDAVILEVPQYHSRWRAVTWHGCSISRADFTQDCDDMSEHVMAHGRSSGESSFSMFQVRDATDAYPTRVYSHLYYAQSATSESGKDEYFGELRRIIEARVGGTDEEREARQLAVAERNRQRTLDEIREWSETVRSANIATRRQAITAYSVDIANNHALIADMYRRARDEQKQLEALLAVTSEQAQVMEQWYLLSGKSDDMQYPGHPRVESVTFVNGVFTVLTTPDLRITREDTNESRWLGQFKLVIPITGRDGIKITNLSTRRGGRDHPHVEQNSPCFGGHEHTMYELLGAGEIYVVVDLIIQYLERLNLTDSWGLYGSYWFDVPDEDPALQPVAETPEHVDAFDAFETTEGVFA